MISIYTTPSEVPVRLGQYMRNIDSDPWDGFICALEVTNDRELTFAEQLAITYSVTHLKIELKGYTYYVLFTGI